MQPKKNTDNNNVMTKYDLKMKRRQEEAIKEKRNKKITMGVLIAIAAAIIIGTVIGVSTHIYTVYKKYIVVGNENVSEVEFDYYYGIYKNSTLSQTLYGTMTYADYFKSYMGYDTSKSDSSQTYSSSTGYTWYDYFSNGTAELIKQNKALLKAAEANGFNYSTGEEDYNEFKDSISSAAQTAGVSVSDYYKQLYGSHASEKNLESYIKNSLKAEAYSTQVENDNTASDQEAQDYYNSNKNSYDTVTYRTFSVAAENSDMNTAKTKADSCAEAATSEDAFISQSVDYVDSDEEDPTLISDAYSSSITNSDIGNWLFDESRKAGDVKAFEDSSSEAYDVVYFVSRDFDSSIISTTIKNTVSQQKYQEFISSYEDAITIENTKNRIKMLEN